MGRGRGSGGGVGVERENENEFMTLVQCLFHTHMECLPSMCLSIFYISFPL
jgi:septin family protein